MRAMSQHEQEIATEHVWLTSILLAECWSTFLTWDDSSNDGMTQVITDGSWPLTTVHVASTWLPVTHTLVQS